MSIVQEWKEKWIATDKARQEALFERDQLRAQLAAAISGGADAAAQRDTALGLCKERERELAECQGQLQSAREMRDTYHRLNLEAREELAETRKMLEEEQELAEHRRADAAAWKADLESTRAELARSEARVKALEEDNERALKLCESLQRGFARG